MTHFLFFNYFFLVIEVNFVSGNQKFDTEIWAKNTCEKLKRVKNLSLCFYLKFVIHYLVIMISFFKLFIQSADLVDDVDWEDTEGVVGLQASRGAWGDTVDKGPK